jgi:hypothetical protein
VFDDWSTITIPSLSEIGSIRREWRPGDEPLSMREVHVGMLEVYLIMPILASPPLF